MLYSGINTGVLNSRTLNENGVPQRTELEQRAIDSINLFDERRTIARQSIHYSGLCADLANEENSEMIGHLTGTVREGMQRLGDLGISESNAGFLQETISGLITSFKEAASTAKKRVEERAESARRAQSQGAGQLYAQQTNESSVQNIEAVNETIDQAINQVQESELDETQDTPDLTSSKTGNTEVTSSEDEAGTDEATDIPEAGTDEAADIPEAGTDEAADIPEAPLDVPEVTENETN